MLASCRLTVNQTEILRYVFSSCLRLYFLASRLFRLIEARNARMVGSTEFLKLMHKRKAC